jgi:DNA-directed RNA polymerase specialized sigma24 family protein
MTTTTARRRDARNIDTLWAPPAGRSRHQAARQRPCARPATASIGNHEGSTPATVPASTNGGLGVAQSAARREQVGAFYARHADRLRRIVARRVRANEHTIEDACHHAWSALARFDDVTLDGRGLAWLAKAAIREGWRLSAVSRRELVLGGAEASASDIGLLERGRAHSGADEEALGRIEHCERVADLRTLKSRERRELFLQAIGYRYGEIAALTGSSYTAVNRRLAEGRAQLRRLERERRDRC